MYLWPRDILKGKLFSDKPLCCISFELFQQISIFEQPEVGVYFCKNLLLLCCKLSTESFMLAFVANTVTVTIWASYSVKMLEVATFH